MEKNKKEHLIRYEKLNEYWNHALKSISNKLLSKIINPNDEDVKTLLKNLNNKK